MPAAVGKREKAWRALDAIARELNASAPEAMARQVRNRALEVARTVGVRALDRLVSKLAGRPVDTAPRAIPRAARQIIDISARPVSVAPVRAPVHAPVHETKRPEPERVPPLPPAAEPVPVVAKPVEPIADVEPAVHVPPVHEPEILVETAPPSFSDTIIEAAPQHDTEIVVEPEPLFEDPDTDPGIVTSHITARPAELGRDTIETMVAPQADEPLPSLPPRFGIDRVVLLAGESEFVFAYWETDPKHLSGPARAELRLLTEGGGLVGRAYVDPVQGRQHLKVPARGKSYYAELVLLDGSADGRTLSRSRDVVVRVPGHT